VLAPVTARPDPAVRLLAAGGGLISLAVLFDSAMEHYRGGFRNPAMVLPLASSAASVLVDTRRAAHPARSLCGAWTVQAVAGAVGVVGLVFHLFNVTKRVGGFSFGNLFHGAPLGAPAALALAGALGGAAQVIAGPRRRPDSVLNDGRMIACLCAIGLLGTSAEAALLHFRGAYHNRAMWAPVVLPPAAALSLARDTVTAQPRALSVGLLGATTLLGVTGLAFHANGIARRMGGWRNWRQNLLASPPLPAPPAFTGAALAGLGALLLMRRAHGGPLS
jgi:hypothetical protein